MYSIRQLIVGAILLATVAGCASLRGTDSISDTTRTGTIHTVNFAEHMLGVRREGVTESAGRLQAAGLIKYSRGHIEVLDRARLEGRVCECYAVVKREYDRLLEKKPMAVPVNTTVLQEPD